MVRLQAEAASRRERTKQELLLRVAALEAFDTAGRVHEFLLTGEERMTMRADPDPQILARGTGLENRPASAGDRRFKIFGMDGCFHG